MRLHQSLSSPSVEHGLHVFPRVNHFLGGVPVQANVPSPRVKVSSVGLHVLPFADAVRMEHELVRAEEEGAIQTLDALGP